MLGRSLQSAPGIIITNNDRNSNNNNNSSSNGDQGWWVCAACGQGQGDSCLCTRGPKGFAVCTAVVIVFV